MSIRGIARRTTPTGFATPTNAPIYIDSDDNIVKIIPAGSGTTEVQIVDASSAQTLTNKTITGSLQTQTTLTPLVAVVLNASQSGTTVFLGPTAGFQITLPAVALGLNFTFVVADNFITSNYTIITPGLVDIIEGGASVAGGDVPAAAEDTISFVASAELKGDYVRVFANATNWFVEGRGTTSGSITFTTAG